MLIQRALPDRPHCSSTTPVSWRIGAVVFCTALAVYLLFFGGHYVMGDHTERIAWAKAWIEHRSNNISSYVPGTQYCRYGIGQSLLHVPFLLFSTLVRRVTHLSCEGPVNMLPYVLNGATGVWLVYRLLLKVGVHPRMAAVRALVIGFASVWFPYTKVEYGESLVTTLLLAVWLSADRKPLLAGLLAGAAVTIRQDALLWVAIAIACSPALSGNKLVTVLGTLPGIALAVWSNWIRTGTFHNSGYETWFDYPLWLGLYGQLFSSGKSVFLFSPLLLLIVPAVRKGLRLSQIRRLTVFAVALACAELLFYGKWWDWSGDDAWGPRFLVPAVMFAQVLIAATARPESKAFVGLAAVGVVLQLMAVLIGPHEAQLLTENRGAKRPPGSMEAGARITWDAMRFSPRDSQVVATVELIYLKCTGRTPHAAEPEYTGSTWLESFDPPIRREEVSWDIFWLHLRTMGQARVGK